MDLQAIDETLSVTGLIAQGGLADLKARGFRSVICNRLDGEGPDQPTAAEIAAAAAAKGLAFRYMPVMAGQEVGDADAFGAAPAELPGPVLAYCRTGTRSATLWSLAEAGRRPLPEILRRTKAAGYGMNGIATRAVRPLTLAKPAATS